MDVKIKRKKALALCESMFLMLVLQVVRVPLSAGFSGLFGSSDIFYTRMGTMAAMAVLSAAVVLYSKLRAVKLSVMPERFSKGYIIFTAVAAVVFITVPQNFIGGWRAVMLLIYASLVTPLYEELLFRGYLWNRLALSGFSEKSVLWLSAAFFTLWHLGYVISQLLSGNWAAVLGKLLAGAGYGIVLGFVRKKYCCYVTILAHGLINVFMV